MTIRRSLLLFLSLLVPTLALSEPRTFSWDAQTTWPLGTTVELVANGVTAAGITSAQYTLDVPLDATRRIDAQARAVTITGETSTWATYSTVVPLVQSAPEKLVIYEGGTVGLPSPWADADIGSTGVAGSADYASGTFTISGSGVDIWNAADAFHFSYQPLNGDGTIVARVATMPSATFYTKVGVMIRESLDAGAKNVFGVNVYGQGARLQTRSATNGLTTATAAGTNYGVPRWLKLTRSGNTFTAYQSADGSTWAQVGSTTISMASSVFVGLALTSHDNSLSKTATLDNVTISQAGSVSTIDASTTLAIAPAISSSRTADYNAGIGLSTTAGTVAGKTADVPVSIELPIAAGIVLARTLESVAALQLSVQTAQVSEATANLLASALLAVELSASNRAASDLVAHVSLALSQAMLASTANIFSESVALDTRLGIALSGASSTSAYLALPASVIATFGGNALGQSDGALTLGVNFGQSTAATAVLGAGLTLGAQLLASPSAAGILQTALTLGQSLSSTFGFDTEKEASTSLGVSLALADSAIASITGHLPLGVVLNDIRTALADLTVSAEIGSAAGVSLSGSRATDAGLSLQWSVGMNGDALQFTAEITLPGGRRVILVRASERMIAIDASDRIVSIH